MNSKRLETNLLLGTIITNMADSILYILTVWYFNENYSSPIMLSIVFSIISIIDAFSFLLGPIIDRTTAKINLFCMSIIQTVLSCILFLLTFCLSMSSITKGVLLVVILTLTYTASAVIYPSGQKIIPMIVEKDRLVKVNSWFSTSEKILDIFFNAISTVIIAFFNDMNTIMIILLLFLMSIKFYYYVSRRVNDVSKSQEETYSFGEYITDLKAGFVEIKKHKEILKLFLPIIAVNFFYGIAIVALPIIAKKYISAEAYGYGSLLVCASIGGVLGTFIVGKLKNIMNKHAVFTALCLLVAGMFWIFMTLSIRDAYILSFIFIFISNASICMMNVIFVVLIQTNIEIDLLGRVSTLTESLASAMVPAGNMAGGILILFINPISVEMLYGFALIICAAPYLIKKKRF